VSDEPIIPIFVLSLPRSGSTLVQRILAAHEGVATASEPWLLLPWLSPLQVGFPDDGPWHEGIHEAVEDFAEVLPGGPQDYRQAVHDAAISLYGRAAGPGARFFVDKTPPYSMIVDEIALSFPEGRLIFLWRNPLGVVASVIDTFADGHWRPNDFPLTLFAGLIGLVNGYRRHADRAFAVRYEDVLSGDPGTWRGLCEYCGFEFDPEALERFGTVELEGRMGDPRVARSKQLWRDNTAAWTGAISTPVRRAWCRRYLRWLGRERLATMGYELDALLAELDALPARGGSVRADLVDSAGSLARAAVKARMGGDGRTSAGWRAVLGRSAVNGR
jgi:hypothetical protein